MRQLLVFGWIFVVGLSAMAEPLKSPRSRA